MNNTQTKSGHIWDSNIAQYTYSVVLSQNPSAPCFKIWETIFVVIDKFS